MTENILPIESSQFLLYTTESGKINIEVFLQEETVWLTQKRMSELFGVDVRTVNEHLLNIFKTRELHEDATIRKIRIVQQEGKREIKRETNFYNLDAIISVGYRVNSIQATHFRKWATQTLREFIIKGFALDDDRLKQAKAVFGKDYFRELLERTVSGFFDYIEGLVERENTFTMVQFAMGVDKFLTFNEYKILHRKGRISKAQAEAKATREYKEFNKKQKIESDFDRMVAQLKAKEKKDEL